MLMDRLDATPNHRREQRITRRHVFRTFNLSIDIHAAQGRIRETAASRNISRHGISILIGRFIHVGTRVALFMATENQIVTRILGHVVRCRMIDGTPFVHEVGITFDETVDIELFSAELQLMRAVVVEPDELTAEILLSSLRGHGYEVDCMPSPIAAENYLGNLHAEGQVVHLILVNDESDEIDGCGFIRRMRSEGYALPLVGVGSLSPEERRNRCREQNCYACTPIPMSLESMKALAASTRRRPITSAIAGDKNAVGMIEKLVTQMPEYLKQLQLAFNEENLSRFGAQLNRIHMFAEHCGFTEVCTEIEKLRVLVRDDADRADMRAALTEVVAACTAAHTPTPPRTD